MNSRKPSKSSGSWIAVKSSHILAVRYDLHAQALYIRFHDDATYRYDNVMPATFDGMLEAPSVGQFFHRYIRGSYRCTAIKEGA